MSLRAQAISGMVWTFAQQFGNQAIGFIVSLVLARILLPAEFGLIGMIGIFVGVGNSLINAGLTQSLIRGKNPDQEDYSTVFYSNLLASIIIYFLIYFSAPSIAKFYDQPVLINIIRVYCLTFIITAFSAVQLARLTKRMDFKTQTLVALPSTIVGGVVGIIMAYKGFGVWSLVWSYLTTSVVGVVQLWYYSRWSPNLSFSLSKFKYHFNFGYKMTLSSLLSKISDNLYLLVIGKYFSAAQVGFYTRAETMKKLPAANLFLALNKVTYPMFAKIQDDNIRLKRVYKELMQMIIFIISPIMIFLGVLAEPLFRFLFTDKWLPAVPFFQVLCAVGILYPILGFNINILKVKGRSDLVLKVVTIQKILVIPAIFLGLYFGIMGLLYAQVVLSLVNFIINAHYTNKFIDYNAWEQAKDILPLIFIGLLAGSLVFSVDLFLKDSMDILRITAGGLIGLGSYFLISLVLKIGSIGTIKKLILHKKKM